MGELASTTRTANLKDWIGLQKEMVQEIGGMLSIALITVNIGITVFLTVSESGTILSNPYVVVPLVVVLIGMVVWVVAHLWHFYGKMHRAKHKALVTLNPFMTTDFFPFEWVLWKNVNLPQLRAQRAILASLGEDHGELDEVIDRVERWVEDGKIPKDDFPEMMKEYLKAV